MRIAREVSDYCDHDDHKCGTYRGDIYKTTFTWTIEDYIDHPEQKGQFLTSSEVIEHGPSDKIFKWQFHLYPRGDKLTSDHKALIWMKNMSDFDVKADFQVSVYDGTKHLQMTPDVEMDVHKIHECNVDVYAANGREGDGGGIDVDLNVDQLKANPSILIDGKDLTLCFSIVVYGDENIFSQEECPGQFSDALIECDGQYFKCHQVILSARSPVFMAMLQEEMKENKPKVITIEDYSPEVVREMHRFIYTESLTDEISQDLTTDLLRAANQYKFDILKRACEEKLCSSLVTGNSVEYLVLGDLHQASKLKRMALTLITMNLSTIVKTEDYKNFHKHHPDLSLEVTLTRFNADEEKVRERRNGN